MFKIFKNVSKIGNVLQNTAVSFNSLFVLNNRSTAMSRNLASRTDAYYNNLSGNYDKVRSVTTGVDVVAGMIMTHFGSGIKNIRILDAGCGTGGPAEVLLKYGFKRISLMDSSVGMLHMAKEKLKREIDNGLIENITEASLPCIPFADDSFEVVMFSWVLHHLVAKPDGSTFLEIIDSLNDTRRVLNKDGLLVILTVTPIQFQEGVWWMKLLPDVTTRYVQRYPSIEQWETIFKCCKFRCLNQFSLLGRDVKGPTYLDAEGPLNKTCRDAFTYFQMTNADEEKELKHKMVEMKNSGTLNEWVKQNDKTNQYGYETVLVCKAENIQ